MSGSVTDPSVGIVGETVVRKRGRPKKVRVDDGGGGGAESKRQKIETWPNASGIGIPGEEPALAPPHDIVGVEQQRSGALEISSNHVSAQQELKQQNLRNLAVMDSKRNAIPGGGKEGPPVLRNNDLRTAVEDIPSELAMRGGALEAVLQVHGICTPAKGGAAIFPGEAGGQEGGGGGGGSSGASAVCSICRLPEIKRQTIICDGCEQSFHVSCVRLSSERANGLDDWTCPSCTIAFNASGGTRGFSELAQQYLDKKVAGRAAAVSKGTPHKGRGKKSGTVYEDDHGGGLDLNVPPEAHEGLDFTRSQNGPAAQNFGQQPSEALQQNEGKFTPGQLPTAIPMAVVSGVVASEAGRASEVKQQLSSLETTSGVKLAESNGELPPESKLPSEKFRGPFDIAQPDKREPVAAAAIDRKVSPEKLTILSKELGNKAVAWNEPNTTNDVAGISGVRTPELTGLPLLDNESKSSQMADGNKWPLSSSTQITEGNMLPLFSSSHGTESKKLPHSNNSSKPEHTSERVVKATDSKSPEVIDISAWNIPRNVLQTPSQKPSVARFVDSFSKLPETGILELPDITYYGHKRSGESRPFTSLLKENSSRLPDKMATFPQTTGVGQFIPTWGGASPGIFNHVDLTGASHGDLNGQQQPSGISYIDHNGVVHDTLHGHQSNSKAFVEGEVARGSVEDQQLKKVGEETLQQLKDFMNEKHGLFLADGWEVEVRKRTNARHVDKYFISPEKQRFRSRLEVVRHLGLPERKNELQQDQPKEWSAMIHRMAMGKDERPHVPFKCGDVVIESLGVVDMRPRFRDELQIWPVGYRSTWHDSATASFCISEVVDNGTWAPGFRVTRNFCPTHGAALNEAVGAPRPGPRTHSHVAGNGIGKESQVMSKQETVELVNRPLLSGFPKSKPHYNNVSDREDKESLNALLGGLGGITDEQEGLEVWDCSQARDVIGEFTVQGNSSAQAWKLFAEEFVRRCRRTPWVLELLPDICPHSKTENGSVQPVASEAPDSEFSGLLERLAEDRFGLSEALVKGMIEVLPNADNCLGYKSLEQRGLSWKEQESVAKPTPPQSRFRIRDKARKHRKASEVVSEEPKEQNGVVELVDKDILKQEIVAVVPPPVVVPPRPAPPAGDPIGRRLPPELVGDVLQIWEFLCRFADVIGKAQPPLLEDLEEGLICEAATVQNHSVRSNSTQANVDEKESNVKLESDLAIPLASGDVVELLNAVLGNGNSDRDESPQSLTILPPPTSQSNGSLLTEGSQQSTKDGVPEIKEEDGKPASGVVPVPASPGESVKPDQVKGEVLSGDGDKAQVAKPLISSEFSTAGSFHIPLINYLLSDLQSKVCGPDEAPGENEDSKPQKRGRKRVRDTVLRPILGREKLSESFSVNEWTWPEIARRYMISVASLPKVGEMAEDNTEECLKVLRCIQGDGGVLCGALDGVAGMEVDAQLLAEAEKELTSGSRANDAGQPPNTSQGGSGKDTADGSKATDGSELTSNWVKILDPIAKLPTNVGSRIRNRVRDALEAAPPDWAVEMLEQSISKQVYKGNASGPTKRIVMEVLSRVRGEDPKVKKTKKQRKRVVPSPEVVMQRCRIVLRQVAAADKGEIVSTGIGTIITHFYESEGEGLLARPLDFRAIDLRLGAGSYGTSPAAFAADVRQIWKNVAAVYGSDSEEFEATAALSELFEGLYSKQVVIFQGGVESTAAAGADGKTAGASGEGAAPNPTGEQAAGQDAGESVKAPWEDDSCRICGIDDDHDNVLLCDGCDAEYHIYCLNPPLQEVPEGNWYCSSCVAVDKGFLEAPSTAEAATETSKAQEKQDEEQVQQKGEEGSGEDTSDKEQLQSGGGLPDDLPWRGLAMKLGETDYWHLTLAERVCLLRFLCDQALDTLKIRIHMEGTMEVALEQQSKLRHLLTERRRHAEFDEARLDHSKAFAILQAGAPKMKRLYPEFGIQAAYEAVDPTPKDHQKALLGPEQLLPSATAGVAVKELQHSPAVNNHSSGLAAMEIDSSAAAAADPTTSREGLEGSEEKPIIISDDCVRPLDTCTPVNDTQRGGGDGGSVSCQKEEAVKDPLAPRQAPGLEAEVGKVALPRGLTSPLDAEIAKALEKLMGVNIRRDLLGRDDHGRGYWALFGSTATPWLAVEVDPDGQSEREGEKTDNAASSPHCLGTLDTDRSGPGQSHQKEGAGDGAEVQEETQKKKPEDERRWFVYSSGEVLDQLIGWLSPSSAQEKALKTTLLQWRGFLLVQRGSDVESEQPDGPLKDSVSQDIGVSSKTRQAPAVPVLRATKLLEWKYGPFGFSTTRSACPPAPPKRGRKKKTQPMAELSRCKCLEPVWVSRWHCTFCHETFDSATDLELHSKGSSCIAGADASAEQEAGKKTGKKGRGGLSSKASETPGFNHFSALVTLPPDASTMPFFVHDSNQDRVNRIGLIKDKAPTFAPGLSVAPAFDPSLMIIDPFGEWSLTSDEGASGSGQELLDSLPIGGTSCFSHGDAESISLSPWVLMKSSEDLPGILEGAADINGVFVVPEDPLGVSQIGSPRGILSAEELQSLASGAPQVLGNLGLPGKTKSGGRLFQVTGKQLVISESSLLPLEDKDIDLLEQLKMHLLDVEAVLSADMLELGRASSSRRKLWRSLVKSAKSIYMMVQATILLEQMVCADFLRSSWGYWSSFSAAAKTATISSLFLRVYALDAAILYENSEGYTGPETSLVETKKGKREKEREEKKKGSESLRGATKKRRKDDGTS